VKKSEMPDSKAGDAREEEVSRPTRGNAGNRRGLKPGHWHGHSVGRYQEVFSEILIFFQCLLF
jgi:hypothetical protein